MEKHDTLPENDIIKCLEWLVNYIDGDRRGIAIAEARPKKWRSMKNIAKFRLPPDGESFVQHLLWANYQAEIWYNFATPHYPPNPLDRGYFQEGSLVLPTPHTQHTTPHSRILLETVFPQKNQKMSQIPQVTIVVLQVTIVIL